MTAPCIALLGNDSSSLSSMRDLLIAEGYRTLRCRPQEVTDAHAVVKRAQADLVILDLWTVPRQDGWAFLRRLWTDIDTTHLPAIVVAGETDIVPIAADLLRTMRCRVLRRPLDARALRGEIAAALGPSRGRNNPPHRAPFRAATVDYSFATADGGDAR